MRNFALIVCTLVLLYGYYDNSWLRQDAAAWQRTAERIARDRPLIVSHQADADHFGLGKDQCVQDEMRDDDYGAVRIYPDCMSDQELVKYLRDWETQH